MVSKSKKPKMLLTHLDFRHPDINPPHIAKLESAFPSGGGDEKLGNTRFLFTLFHD